MLHTKRLLNFILSPPLHVHRSKCILDYFRSKFFSWPKKGNNGDIYFLYIHSVQLVYISEFPFRRSFSGMFILFVMLKFHL